MSATKKILIIIFSLLLIGVLAFLITWGVINFNKVKDLMSGTGIYNKTDVDNAYNDGYNTALKDKDEWDKLLNDYRDTITVQTDTISQLNSDKSALDKSIKDYETQLTNLTEERTDLENQIKLLNEEIASLNNTIEVNATEKQALIEQHTQTVSRLNAQITGLNGQIEELNNKINANAVTVASLNDRITELQGTIAKYQEFIAQFETEDKAVVTFEFAGSVYSVQVVDKGGKVIVETPTSSDYVIFNGWTLNGEAIDLSTYTVTETVRIVADVTYKYVVTFVSDGNVKSTQIIEKGNYVTETPTVRKTGYTFKYWTLDGETEVHFEQLPITANTAFIAKFNQLHSVDFTYENGESIINTKKVEHGTFTTAPRVSLNDGDVLNGWRVNGSLVNVGSYVINSDTVFVADITRNYTVSFMVDGVEYEVQNVLSGSTAKNVNISNKGFNGWKVDDYIVDVERYTITSDTIFVASFAEYLVSVYDGDTLLYSGYHREDETVIFDVEPLGREGYVFTGYYEVNFETENDFRTIKTPCRSLVVGNRNFTLYAYYALPCTGYFTRYGHFTEDLTIDYSRPSYLNIGYNAEGYFIKQGLIPDNFGYAHLAIYTPAMETLSNYNLKDGTYRYDKSSNEYYIGRYDAETDSWIFNVMTLQQGSWVKSVDYTVEREAYSIGTCNEDLLK